MTKTARLLRSPVLARCGLRLGRRRIATFTALLLLIAWTTSVRAQITDVAGAFERVKRDGPQKFKLSQPVGTRLLEDPSASHQQSIQRTSSGGFIVSGSRTNTGYLYVTNAQGRVTSKVTPRSGDFNHLGGFQIAENIVAVGYEKGKNWGSKVLFFEIRADNSLSELTHLALSRNVNTAGAVGLVRTGSSWSLVVGDWDSAQLDFYQCTQSDLSTAQSSFRLTGSWSKASDGLAAGSIDGNWEAYQNINLFQQTDSTLWFVGMHTKKTFGLPDWADLYQVTEQGGRVSVVKRGKKHFIAKGGPRFVYGSGFFWDAASQRFDVYAIAPHMEEEGNNIEATMVNHWR